LEAFSTKGQVEGKKGQSGGKLFLSRGEMRAKKVCPGGKPKTKRSPVGARCARGSGRQSPHTVGKKTARSDTVGHAVPQRFAFDREERGRQPPNEQGIPRSNSPGLEKGISGKTSVIGGHTPRVCI